jgi:hypothetical protein
MAEKTPTGFMFKNRPPIGIMPRYIWVEKRVDELKKCILRYKAAELEIKPAWIRELMEHIVYLEREGIAINTNGSAYLESIRIAAKEGK